MKIIAIIHVGDCQCHWGVLERRHHITTIVDNISRNFIFSNIILVENFVCEQSNIFRRVWWFDVNDIEANILESISNSLDMKFLSSKQKKWSIVLTE